MLGGKRSQVSAMTLTQGCDKDGQGVRPKLLQAVPHLRARGTSHRTNHISEKTPNRLCGLAVGKSRFDGVARYQAPILIIKDYQGSKFLKAARPSSISHQLARSGCRDSLRGAADI